MIGQKSVHITDNNDGKKATQQSSNNTELSASPDESLDTLYSSKTTETLDSLPPFSPFTPAPNTPTKLPSSSGLKEKWKSKSPIKSVKRLFKNKKEDGTNSNDTDANDSSKAAPTTSATTSQLQQQLEEEPTSKLLSPLTFIRTVTKHNTNDNDEDEDSMHTAEQEEDYDEPQTPTKNNKTTITSPDQVEWVDHIQVDTTVSASSLPFSPPITSTKSANSTASKKSRTFSDGYTDFLSFINHSANGTPRHGHDETVVGEDENDEDGGVCGGCFWCPWAGKGNGKKNGLQVLSGE